MKFAEKTVERVRQAIAEHPDYTREQIARLCDLTPNSVTAVLRQGNIPHKFSRVRKQKNNSVIAEIAKAAKAAGMSYGEYVDRMDHPERYAPAEDCARTEEAEEKKSMEKKSMEKKRTVDLAQLRAEVNEALEDVVKARAVCVALCACNSSDQDALRDVAHDYLDRIVCRLNQMQDEMEEVENEK